MGPNLQCLPRTLIELTTGRLNRFFCGEPIRYQDGTPIDATKPGVEEKCGVRVPAIGLKCKYHNAVRRAKNEPT